VRHSDSYTVMYAAAVTLAVSVVLSVTATSLGPRQQANATMAKRRAILQTVMPVDAANLERDYETFISERVFSGLGTELADLRAEEINPRDEVRKSRDQQRLPVYVFHRDGMKRYIVPLQGAGLWGPIGAHLALEPDLATIAAVAFSHEKETPGLGAEIDKPFFEGRFAGKRVRDEQGLRPVVVLRGTGNDTSTRPHAVDGITGATITLNGVSDMFRNELERYDAVFANLRKQEQQ